ncbi:MAG: hypothetical protein DIZ80_00365 [endosymbiont of Galathealinum brachiosum]|uniref:Uncharacterized protein n=1 Tax=endosymbiont of Galathealinum brachiosum TaxID=2200906 RepID=A0A370DNL2_9GAMM|nr:MAG: hypothetical protein DIZ80_00365 [endosymbiont of Galathealinum brachiosum]
MVKGELGSIEDRGVVVTLKQFKAYFSDVTTDYNNSFLPASTIEPGRVEMSRTRFLYRLRKGVYLVHGDALDEFIEQQLVRDDVGGDGSGEVKETGVCYEL